MKSPGFLLKCSWCIFAAKDRVTKLTKLAMFSVYVIVIFNILAADSKAEMKDLCHTYLVMSTAITNLRFLSIFLCFVVEVEPGYFFGPFVLVLVNSTSLFMASQEYNNLCFHSFRSVHVLQLGTQRTRCERHVTPQGTHGLLSQIKNLWFLTKSTAAGVAGYNSTGLPRCKNL